LLTALPGPLQPFIQDEFKLNNTQLGGLTSAFSISSAFAQLPAGWFAYRIGPTILITIGIVGVGIGGVLIGLSTTYVMLMLFLIFLGLMSGGYHPASTPLISISVPTNQRGRALGLHLIGGNSSFFLAPLIGGAIAAAWDWRASFLTLAIPTIILGTFFFIYLNKRYGKAYVEAMRRRQAEEKPPQPGYKRRLIA
jgi:MFS family permease